MLDIKAVPFHGHICGWGEGVCWNEHSSTLAFVDCLKNQALFVDCNNPESISVVQTPSMPTKLLLTPDPRTVIVVLQDGLYQIRNGVCAADPLIPMPSGFDGRFNDATTDAVGRLVTGTLSLEQTGGGAFWVWGRESGWSQLSLNKSNTNGPCFSEDGRVLYIADTPTGNIYRYDYNSSDGSASNESIFVNTFGDGGAPDGAAIDADGCLWSALYGGGVVVQYAADGSVRQRIELPAKNPTDVQFFGPTLDRMIVTSAIEQNDDVTIANPNAGVTFEIFGAGARGIRQSALAT